MDAAKAEAARRGQEAEEARAAAAAAERAVEEGKGDWEGRVKAAVEGREGELRKGFEEEVRVGGRI